MAGHEPRENTGDNMSSKRKKYKKVLDEKNFLETKVELFLEELFGEKVRFRIRDIFKAFITVEILGPVHRYKGIPVDEMKAFLDENRNSSIYSKKDLETIREVDHEYMATKKILNTILKGDLDE